MEQTNMTKTYTQKQYDAAKERAYFKGWKAGWESPSVEDAMKSAVQVQEWNKWDQFDFDCTVVLLIVACVGAILMMIF